MKKFIIFTISLLTIIFPLQVFAETNIITRSDWHVDESLASRENDVFSQVDNIYVVGMTLKDKEIRINTDYWVKGLYYFFTTKTQFDDIPFNYFVGWDGQVFEGMSHQPELIAPVKDKTALIIGYLSNYDSAEITRLGQDALEELLVKLANENNVDPSNISAADWRISPTDDLQTSYIEIFESARSVPVEKTLKTIMPDIQKRYNPRKREYKAEVLEVTVPNQLEVENEYEVQVRVKNTGETNWYKNSKSEVTVSRKDNAASEYQIQNAWISDSQAKGQTEDVVKPGEEIELLFSISTPLISGEYTEKFELKTLGGTILENTEFELKTDINAGANDLVEVKDTPTGYLNVRQAPSTGGALITQILPGEKFIVLEKQPSWYKLRLKDGQEGWAAKQYLRDL